MPRSERATRLSPYNGRHKDDKNTTPHQPAQTQNDGQLNNAPTRRKRMLRRSNLVTTPTLHKEEYYGNDINRSPQSRSADASDETQGQADVGVLRKTSESDMDDYDYKTFSTGRPLRLSKVKAFEQSELTMRMFFSKGLQDEDNWEYVRSTRRVGKNASVNSGRLRHKKEDEILVQLPGLSRLETQALIRPEDQELELGSGGSDENAVHSKSWSFLGAEKRLNAMRSALKPVPEDQLLSKRLHGSQLPQVFQNTGQFLQEMELQEIEYWELLNDEFEADVDAARRDSRNHGNPNEEEELHFLDAPYDALYGKKVDEDLLVVVAGDIRRKVKEALNVDDELVIDADL